MLRPGNPMRMALLSVLLFEVIVFGLSIPVMVYVSERSWSLAALAGGGAALLALAATALLRRPVGWAIGWLTQVAGVALGLLTPGMFIAGGIFAGLWVLTIVLGRKLDARSAGPAATAG